MTFMIGGGGWAFGRCYATYYTAQTAPLSSLSMRLSVKYVSLQGQSKFRLLLVVILGLARVGQGAVWAVKQVAQHLPNACPPPPIIKVILVIFKGHFGGQIVSRKQLLVEKSRFSKFRCDFRIYRSELDSGTFITLGQLLIKALTLYFNVVCHTQMAPPRVSTNLLQNGTFQ